MRITQITERHRNDFKYWAKCESCGHEEHYGDGYADEFHCLQVVPHRYCEKCGLNSVGEKSEREEIT